MSEVRPSVEEVRGLLQRQLSMPARLAICAALLFDLCVGAAVASLLITEVDLPARTQAAFGMLILGSLAWAVFLLYWLTRRQGLLVRQRIVAARLALGMSALFTLGSISLRALPAALFGAALMVVAALLHQRGSRRLAELLATRARLSGALLLLVCTLPGSAGEVPLIVEVPHPPDAAPALGREHLVYELHLTPTGQSSLDWQRLEVVDETGQRLAMWQDEALDSRVIQVDRPNQAVSSLEPGRRHIAYIWVAMRPGAERPRLLVHRLDFGEEGSLEIAPLAVGTQTFTSTRPPFAQGRWAALRGPANGSGHRRSFVTRRGAVTIPQRFAVDWVRLGPDGRLFSGDGAANEDWYSFDQPVLAVHEGSVVKVVRGIADHRPNWPGVRTLPVEDLAGNTVIVEEGDGVYSIYAHLRAGSIEVEPGDLIEAGERIGSIGNSGHSRAPHLHYHRSDRPVVLGGEGRPFTIADLRLLGKLDGFEQAAAGAAWKPDPRRPPRRVTGEMPLADMVVERAR